jgi:ADP-ribosylglycohydrolase
MDDLQPKKQNCLFGAFLGDALSMPVHWYYDRSALARDYGRVVKFVFMADIKFSVFSVQFSAKAGSSALRRRLEICLSERLLR